MARRSKNVDESSALTLAPGSALAALSGLFDPSLMAGAAVAGGGIAPFIRLEDGVITDGQNEIGDTLDLVILGAAVEHALYPGAFNPNKQDDPVCFYVGSSEADAKPHASSPQPQAASCATCVKNAFGSAANGRAKACGQRRRLLVLPLGEDDDVEQAPLRRLRVPPTSAKFLDAYVKLVEGHKRPVQSVVTTLFVVEDKKDRFHVRFKPARPINDRPTLEALARHAETGKDALFSVWTPSAKPQAAAPTGRRVVKRS